MKLICKKSPSLYVYDLKVRFEKGIAEVKDEKTAKKLTAMKDYDIEILPETDEPEKTDK